MKKTQTLRVLVASRNEAIPAALAAVQTGTRRVRVEPAEAVSTGVAYASLAGCALAIVDREDLIPSPGVSPELFDRTLAQSGIPVVSGAEFAASPSAWLERATASAGLIDALPPRTVMLTTASGGVGKTTLTLNLARYVAGTLRLPVAAIEINFGESALRSLTDPALPDLYDALTQGKEIGKWEAAGGEITLLPMVYSSARLLLNRADEVRELVGEIAGRHVLTLVDAHAANPFIAAVQARVDLTLVVADGRPDALANATHVVEDDQAQLILNKVDGIGDRLALSGVKAAARLPLVNRPEDDSRLAEALLQVIYPGWKPAKK